MASKKHVPVRDRDYVAVFDDVAALPAQFDVAGIVQALPAP